MTVDTGHAKSPLSMILFPLFLLININLSLMFKVSFLWIEMFLKHCVFHQLPY